MASIFAAVGRFFRGYFGRFRRAGTGGKLVYGCLPVVVLLACCGMFQPRTQDDRPAQLAGLPERTVAPAMTPPPRPTDVAAVPTDAPVVEPTPAPTEAIAEPTLEPTLEPTIAPASGLSPEVQSYLAAASGPVGTYGRALGRLGEQSTKVGNDPTLFTDQTWIIDTAAATVDLDAAAEGIGALASVPPEAATLDGYLKQISTETPLMTDEYRRGVDSMDADLLTSAVGRLNKISGWIQEAQTEFQRIQSGAVAAPASQPAAAPVGADCPQDSPVKGNQGDEWIYHVPGGGSYSVTEPEQCFATSADAEAAGYRAAQN